MNKLVVACLTTFAISLSYQGYSQHNPRFQDSAQSLQTHVDDLMRQMTLEEKIAQLQSQLLFLPRYAQSRDFTVGHFRNIAHFMHENGPATPGACAAAISKLLALTPTTALFSVG
jgi:hypothetical protein